MGKSSKLFNIDFPISKYGKIKQNFWYWLTNIKIWKNQAIFLFCIIDFLISKYGKIKQIFWYWLPNFKTWENQAKFLILTPQFTCSKDRSRSHDQKCTIRLKKYSRYRVFEMLTHLCKSDFIYRISRWVCIVCHQKVLWNFLIWSKFSQCT